VTEPQDESTLIYRSQMLQTAGRRADALALLDGGLADNPDSVALLVALATFHLSTPSPSRSLAAARRAVELDGQGTQAWAPLALALLMSQRGDEAEAAAREAIRLDPAEPGAHAVLASVLHSQVGLTNKSGVAAAAAIAHALELNPHDPALFDQAATIAIGRARPDEALGLVRRGLALDPTDAALLLTKAKLDGRRKKSRIQGIETVKSVLAVDPLDADALTQLRETFWARLRGQVISAFALALVILLVEPWLSLHRAPVTAAAVVLFAGRWAWMARKLRRALPPGFIRRELRRRPEGYVAIACAVLAQFTLLLGMFLAAVASAHGAARAALVTIMVAGTVAWMGWMLVLAATNRDSAADRQAMLEADPDRALSRDVGWAVRALLGVHAVPAACAAGYLLLAAHAARPAAAHGVVTLLAGVAAGLCGVGLLLASQVPRRWRDRRWNAVRLLLLVLLVADATAGLGQAAALTYGTDVVYTGRPHTDRPVFPRVPAPVTVTIRPFPSITVPAIPTLGGG